MALDTAEAIAAAFRELPIFNAVQGIVQKLPPVAERKFVDYAPIVGAKPGTVIYKVLDAVDRKGVKFIEVIDILEVDPQGPLGLQLAAIDVLIEDIKD